MFLNNLKIAAKINLAFAALIAGVAVSSGVTYVSIQAMSAAAARSEAALTVTGQSAVLLTDVLEQTNALRGYVIKGEPKFLATYRDASAAFDKALDEMAAGALSADDAARYRSMRKAMATWRADIGDKVVSLMATPGGQAEAANLSGVKSLTRIRQIQGEISSAAAAAAARGRADDAHATAVGLGAILGGGLIALVIAGVMGVLLSMTIARPVARMTGLMRRLVNGDLDVAAPAAQRTDEVGEMGQAILSFRDAAVRKLELEAEALIARRAAEAERDRNEAAARAAADELAAVMDAVAKGLSRLAKGDLSFQLTETFAAQYQALKDDLNKAVTALRATVVVICAKTEAIDDGVGEIASAADDLSRRTEHQAAALEQTAAALDQITATVRNSALTAAEAGAIVTTARGAAEDSRQIVAKAISAMSGIQSSSYEISQIVDLIDEIAFQTNLLALNAGVEAARAGDAGRGFAIVATEVRALAQRSAAAAKQIETLIAKSSVHVSAGVELVGETGQALNRIMGQVLEIDTCVGGLASAAKEQAAGLADVNAAVGQMDQVTQQNAAMVEQTSAATQSLSSEAAELRRELGRFSVGAPSQSRQRAA